MANEIALSFDSASTLYALVYRQSDGYIYDVGHTAFEAVGTWNDARVAECDIAMTASGDMHFGTFPVVAAGTYYVQIRKRVGASPDTDDIIAAQGFMVWGGTAEVLPSDITADIAAVVVDIAAVQADVASVLVAQQMVRSVETSEETVTKVIYLQKL